MTHTALVVDDSTSMRHVLAFTLKTAGIEAIEAENGQMALDLARQRHFDVVLADINMPVMNGLELVKELRKLSSYRFTPILTITTECSDSMKEQGKSAGCTGWVIKPVNPDKLITALRKLIK